jgi:hypothetical protein
MEFKNHDIILRIMGSEKGPKLGVSEHSKTSFTQARNISEDKYM